MKRLTFYGCSAFQGRIDAADGCSFWGEDPNALSYDQSRLIPISFSRTPTTVPIGSWDKPNIGVQLDDHLSNKGLTTLGPNFKAGSLISQDGGVYLEATTWLANKKFLMWPPSNGPVAQYQYKVALWCDETDPTPLTTIARYLGHRVKVRKRTGSCVVVELFRAGSNKSKVLTFDLDDPTQCSPNNELDTDPASPYYDGAVEQVMKSNTVVDGALFVNTVYAASLGLFIPKLPPTSGNTIPFP